MAYKPNDLGRLRLFSANFESDGLIDIPLDTIPEPGTTPDSWARFPMGVAWILKREGYAMTTGMDAVLYGNIPGGGMSRSASLTLNLLISLTEVNGISLGQEMRTVDLAQAVENDYIGSPCGNLDQIMILFAKEGMGTHYNPADRAGSAVRPSKNANRPAYRTCRLGGARRGSSRAPIANSTGSSAPRPIRS